MSHSDVEVSTVKVTVHFIAAGRPFQQDFARSDTIGAVKTATLNAFELIEGTNEEGNSVTYTLFNQKTPLENLNTTVGDVAGHQHVLQLKLNKQITQG